MLSKTFKYEFRAVAKIAVPLIIAVLALGLIIGVIAALSPYLGFFDDSNHFGETILALFFGLIAIAACLAIIALNVVTFIIILSRFYSNFFTDEGYLTFTLPVTVDCHLWTKIISGTVWTLLSSAATFISVIFIFIGVNISTEGELLNLFIDMKDMLLEAFGMIAGTEFIDNAAFLIESVLTGIVSFLSQIMLLYLAISLGSMIAKKHKILASIGMLFVVNMVVSWISTIIFQLLNLSLYISNDTVLYAHLYLIISILLDLVVGAAAYLLMRLIISRKLNLE